MVPAIPDSIEDKVMLPFRLRPFFDFRFLFLLKIARSYLQMPETQVTGDKASDFLQREEKGLNYANM